MTIDGHALDADAARELEELSRVAALAQYAAPPRMRIPPAELAANILAAFRCSCRVARGVWTPRHVIRIQGHSFRSTFARRQENA